MERPLLHITPQVTPVIASAGMPAALTISPLIVPENVSLSSIPVLLDLDREGAAPHQAHEVNDNPPPQQASTVVLDLSGHRHTGSEPEPAAETLSAPGGTQPRFHSPATQVVLGLPRVLGIPAQVAQVSLGENCCDHLCLCFLPRDPLSENRRLVYSRFANFCALNVLVLCGCADVLSSGGRMPWDRSTKPTSHTADFPFGNFLQGYVDGCLINGMPPDAIIGATVLYTLAALLTLIVTIHIVLTSRGCILCCAPASCCGDLVCSAGVLLSLALAQLVAGIECMCNM